MVGWWGWVCEWPHILVVLLAIRWERGVGVVVLVGSGEIFLREIEEL
jgi:hypothetical protein